MRKKESGITLISLIVAIIILVILAAVSIRGIAGEESIIRVSETATEDYNILQYKDKIEQLRESVILEYEMTGERLSLDKLAREMLKEATWIRSSVANVSGGENDINDDIIVTTTDGYIFQLYYNEGYGQKFIEYLGKEDGNAIPEVTTAKVNNKISVTAKEDVAGINGIEVIYKGDVVKAEKASTLEYDAPQTGWYTIRVTSNKGKLRYAWVRIASTMIAPKIEIVKPTEKPGSGWYKENVTVRISAQSEKTTKIYYTIANWREEPTLEISGEDKINGVLAKDIELKLQGINSIYAYAVDESTGESEIVKLDALIDSEAPILRDVNVTGIKGENGWYRGEVGLSLENARDNASGVSGYYYYIPTKEEIESGFVPELNQMQGENGQVGGNAIGKNTIMKITEDGIKTIILRLQDRAGNISTPVTVTVKADNTPPIISLVEVKEEDIAGDGFIITAQASDQPLDAPLSEVTYFYYVQEVGMPGRRFVASTKESRCMVEGLKAKTDYIVYVEVKDEAGNTAALNEGAGTKITTGEEGTQINPGGGNWRRPVEDGNQGGNTGGNQGASMVAIQIRPKNNSYKLNSGWYTGNVEVTITCIATEPQMIKYTVTRGTEIEVDEDPVGDEGPITFDITNEGISTIVAWTVDDSGNPTPKKTVNVKIDKNDPQRPTVVVTKDGTVDITNDADRWVGVNGTVTAAGDEENPAIGLKVQKIEYQITKGSDTREDSQNGQIINLATKDLGDDGAYVLKFWAVDQAGRKSAEYTEVSFSKDTIAPTDVKFTSTNAMSQRISVTVTGKDTNGSGIYEYIFKYKPSSGGSYSVADTITVNNAQTCTFAYTGLSVGASYDLVVEVRDKAGNSTTASTDGYVSTKEWKAKIGDYVAYSPKSGSHNVAATTYSGYGTAQSFSTDTGLQWRIWDIDEDANKLTIIADGVTSKTLYLQGAQGYNNAVKLMNDICKACYSSSSGRSVGRAFNFADIEEKLKTKPTYTSRQTYATHYYPVIHMFEEYSNVDGNNIPKGGEAAVGVKALTRSQQTSYYSATSNGATSGYKKSTTSIAPIQTYQAPSLSTSSFSNSAYYYMTLKSGNSSNNLTNYWLASRCVYLDGTSYALFGVQYVGGSVGSYYLFNSSNASRAQKNYAVRPVVDIPLSSVTLATSGAGTSASPYGMTGY